MSPRISMSLTEYMAKGQAGHRACFACGAVDEPMPPTCSDSHGAELRCRVCGQESALPLHAAVRERWLEVVGPGGETQNDRVRA